MHAKLQTERLRLEPLGSHHVPAYLAYQLRNRRHLAPWEPTRADAYYTPDAIAREIARAELDDSAHRWIVFEHASETAIGLINLWNIRRGVIHSAILGYSIDEQQQGRGFATEAARAVVAFAFEKLNLHRLETSYQPENTASGRVLRKIGFLPEGYARDYLFINGAWRDGILVSLINERWTLPGV